MSALPMARPAGGSSLDPHDAAIDLDTRIGAVEGRLMAREQRIGDQVRQLGARASQLAAPRLLLLKLGGAVAAGAGLVWALRHGSRPVRPHAGMPSWAMHLLPLAVPLAQRLLRRRPKVHADVPPGCSR